MRTALLFGYHSQASNQQIEVVVKDLGSFPFEPPSLVGAYYLQPPDARAIFLHSDLLCNCCCCCCWGFTVFTEGIFVPVVVLENCPIISADLTVTA